MTMTPEALVRAGDLDGALAALQGEIRNRPEDGRLRIFLFQLNSILGRWEKALTQLQVLHSLDADSMVLAQVFRPNIACEMLRHEVFAGRRTPLVFGEPTEWMGLLIQACAHVASGNFEAAAALRTRAFDDAPASTGTLDGNAFEWLADADSRLGPVFEVYTEGKYFWVPMCRVQKVVLQKPTDLRDLVWISAEFTWTNGGTLAGFIPVRYPGTEESKDSALLLARRTEWLEHAGETYLGLGQRVFATDAGEHSLLECGTIEFSATA